MTYTGIGKISKTLGGFHYFAQVEIRVETAANALNVLATLDASGNTAKSWLAAAIQGAQMAGKWFMQQEKLNGLTITVTKILGTTSDTPDDVVACAAGLAVDNALHPTRPWLAPLKYQDVLMPFNKDTAIDKYLGTSNRAGNF